MKTASRCTVPGLLLIAAVTACSSNIASLVFGDTGAIDSGTNESGFTGFLSLRLSSQLGYLFGNPIGPPTTGDTVQECVNIGACGFAWTDSVFGTIQGVGPFTVVSTSNFFYNGSLVVVVRSGVTTQTRLLPSPGAYKALQLRLQWAYLTSRLDPSTHDDSAVVRIVTATDSAQALLVTAADLANGRIATQSGGCGDQSIGGIAATYSTCTAWATATLDVTRFAGDSVQIHFIASRANQLLADTANAPTALLFQNVMIEGAH